MGGHLPKEIPYDTFQNIPADKDVDVLVANTFIGDRGAESVDEAHSANNKAGSCETLSTPIGVESLGRDNTLKRSVCEAEENLEEEISCQRAFGV